MTMAASDPKSRELIQTVSQISNALMNEVSKVIIGKQENLRRISVGILSNGNMLIEDFPGLAKTLMANTFANVFAIKVLANPGKSSINILPFESIPTEILLRFSCLPIITLETSFINAFEICETV